MNPRQIETRRMLAVMVIVLIFVTISIGLWELVSIGKYLAREGRPLQDHRNYLGPRLLLRFRPTGRCSQPMAKNNHRQKNEAPADPFGPRL